ncbi:MULTISPECIES: hypothetical protein [unclassified Polynucleobacter]|uniref:hypothetical protein n=1 Tax=unclassified Polynucleobacter TaxID=2640945 RepID=UPI0008BA5895|nr:MULTISPECIES: hypothetical protein [unclassified Polynucleobacter]MBU3591213.1 hypothetical protein [Polynucleobacter sp. 78F-HAINBA]OHC09984.1 MAG: hypothetical protein A2X74_09415 [Polynucleobacter sp. GWA2_45_21]HBK43039.1 hypothetical protein [Polynucleobacter sp.]
MRLFHGSRVALEFKEYRALNLTSYYPDVVTALEKGRPIIKPSRSLCLFAADSAAWATRFMYGQGVNSSLIYEVEMEVFHRAPFGIVHEINSRLKVEGSIDNLVAEYWDPKANWSFYEYFGPSFRVISQVQAADSLNELTVCTLSYGRDTELSKSF